MHYGLLIICNIEKPCFKVDHGCTDLRVVCTVYTETTQGPIIACTEVVQARITAFTQSINHLPPDLTFMRLCKMFMPFQVLKCVFLVLEFFMGFLAVVLWNFD